MRCTHPRHAHMHHADKPWRVFLPYPLQLADNGISATELASAAGHWLKDCLGQPDLNPQLCASRAVATFIARALEHGHPTVQALAFFCLLHLINHSQIEASISELIPLASRLAVNPLRDAPAGPLDVEIQQAGDAIQLGATSFLGRMLLFGDKEQRHQALKAEPRLVEATIAFMRKGWVESDGSRSMHQTVGSASWLLTAFLEVGAGSCGPRSHLADARDGAR